MTQEPLAGLLELETKMRTTESQTNRGRFATVEGFVELEAREVPIAVHLGDRALALENIMAFYNTDSRVAGSAKAIKNPSSRFCRLYGDAADKVQQGAKKNRDERAAGFREAVGLLAAADALRANGYDEADSGLATIIMQHDLNVAYGANSGASSSDRNVLVASAKKTAEELGVLDRNQRESSTTYIASQDTNTAAGLF